MSRTHKFLALSLRDDCGKYQQIELLYPFFVKLITNPTENAKPREYIGCCERQSLLVFRFCQAVLIMHIKN
jgi:hypothetical protein